MGLAVLATGLALMPFLGVWGAGVAAMGAGAVWVGVRHDRKVQEATQRRLIVDQAETWHTDLRDLIRGAESVWNVIGTTAQAVHGLGHMTRAELQKLVHLAEDPPASEEMSQIAAHIFDPNYVTTGVSDAVGLAVSEGTLVVQRWTRLLQSGDDRASKLRAFLEEHLAPGHYVTIKILWYLSLARSTDRSLDHFSDHDSFALVAEICKPMAILPASDTEEAPRQLEGP